uniref:Coenzyme Q-binding protein COQ10 START domain-containing protein n=1 Tax=Oryza glumipatula TaxID=40148 RepID=A0A0D9ZFI5_9ORYZ
MTSRVLVSSSSSSSAAAAAAFLPRIPNPCANPSHRGAPPCGAALWRHHSGRAVTTAAAAAATGDHWGAEYHGGGGGRGGKSAAGPGVQCDVDVVSWRERRVFASVAVAADVDTVWRVITDYERLAEFIPNLVHSGRIPCPHQGRVWLEQRGLQQALYWHIEARVVLDLKEVPDAVNGRELHFSMVDGDFKKFEGKWSIRSGPRSSSAILLYEVNVIPRFNFPAIFLERIIRSDLPVNLGALACRAENIYLGNQRHGTAKFSGAGSRFHNFRNATTENDAIAPSKFTETPPSGLGGVLASPPSELNSKWGVYGNVCRLDRPCVVDEIHLRRFDGLLEHEGAHRFVFASITVKAPVREVWNILTAYEKLPDSDILLYKYELTKLSVRFVPNLAISRIIRRDNNKVRILQEGCKGLLYMVLHARVVMDLREKLEREISFEQVEGDFYSFKGKWRLEQLGDQHTLLKYMVETKMHKDTFLSESILEEVIYEDLPSNLCAIRDYIEKAEAESGNSTSSSIVASNADTIAIDYAEGRQSEQASTSCSSSPVKQRPKVPGLQKDIEVLKSELEKFIAKYGQDGFMPKRKHLRLHGRVDIEKAITRMGGFRKIASIMNLSLSYKNRKPRGYWDNLENLQEEIRRFQKNWGMDPAYMPSRKSFERAGRYDIARALEKWGGVHEVSRLLSLELRRPRRRANSDDESKAGSSYAITNKHASKPNKPSVSPDKQKWLLKLKDLDANWIEY